jgi:hypothetical protein
MKSTPSKSTSSSLDGGDDDDDLAAAFQQFMLQGKKQSSTLSSSTSSPTPSSQKKGKTTTPSDNSSSSGSSGGQSKRRPRPSSSSVVRPIIKAWQGRLQDWNQTDQQLQQVVSSIWNLRTRLAWESSQLRLLRLLQQQEETRNVPWQGCGFRSHNNNNSTASSFLLVKDVDMALDYDLLQHERMLATLRSLMASLAQTLDAASRRLEEWMMNVTDDTMPLEEEDPQQQQQQQPTFRLEDALQLYRWLSQDLYQKQMAVQDILESSHDGILDPDAPQTIASGETPQHVAKRALKAWSSMASSSDMTVPKKQLLDRFLSII